MALQEEILAAAPKGGSSNWMCITNGKKQKARPKGANLEER